MQTNIFKAIGIPAVLCSLVYAGCFVKANEFPSQKPVYVEYFKPGQVILPDYACSDTLIVKDAEGLNIAMGYIEQGIIDATDDCIDSTFHCYCTIK